MFSDAFIITTLFLILAAGLVLSVLVLERTQW